jgi:hypothetical protein
MRNQERRFAESCSARADLSGELDVTPDAKRFAMIRHRKEAGSQAVRWVLVQNWLADVAPTP